MGLETHEAFVDRFGLLFEALFYGTQAIFALEIAVRVISFHPNLRAFFRDFWNTFDFIIIAVSFLPGIGPVAVIARLFRVVRLLRILSVSDHLRGFSERLGEALDEIAYSALMMLVLGYIFAISGNYFFYEAAPQHWGSLGRSAISIFYLLLLQNVPGFVEPLITYSSFSILFFITFYVTVFGLLISVLTAAINPSSRVR